MKHSKQVHTLAEVPAGMTATVAQLDLSGSIRTRLRDLGLIEGTPVTCLGCGPSGDPVAYLIRGAVIALRRSDSGRLEVREWV